MPVWSSVLDALDRHGRAAMVTVAGVKGSAPREPGARLVVHPDGAFTGTIGGGTLEWRALALAQAALADKSARKAEIRTFALGPELGQCCGGQVELIVEPPEAAQRAAVADSAAREASGRYTTHARSPEEAGVTRQLDAGGDMAPGTASFRSGVLSEGFGDDRRQLLLFGAGHVGRALVLALAPLPFAVTWVDSRPDAFPKYVPANVTMRRLDDPLAAFDELGKGGFVLVMSHSHQLDLAIVNAALADERVPYVGLIGSKSKRARFEKRLTQAGISGERIASLVCPIGVGGIRSKAPAVIAAATAAELIIRDETLRAAGTGGASADTPMVMGGRG
jgi:xanthine dehydrogenase accessory factor